MCIAKLTLYFYMLNQNALIKLKAYININSSFKFYLILFILYRLTGKNKKDVQLF
jgi:hypothetical protein